MTDDPALRASDDDRDRVAAQLREHHAAGRLSPGEFSERLDQALEARTMGELAELTKDLPAIAAAAPAVPEDRPDRKSMAWRNLWAGYLACNSITFAIWLIMFIRSGDVNGFWFLWVAGPWGAILLSRWLLGASPDGKEGKREVDGDRPRHELGGH